MTDLSSASFKRILPAWLSRPSLGVVTLTVVCALFVVTVDSYAFWSRLFQVVDASTLRHAAFLVTVFVVLVAWLTLFFSLFGIKYLFKPVLIVMLVTASMAGYFMSQNGVVIDSVMIRNMAETNYNEASELLTAKSALYFLATGLLPALFVIAVRIKYRPFFREVLVRGATMLMASVLLVGGLLAFYKDFSFVGREHSDLRFYINPTYPVHSVVKYFVNRSRSTGLVLVGADAHRKAATVTDGKSTLVLVVVGETARASAFSLNGYGRLTNPELGKEHVINFRNVSSCGTSTAISVPCMFSMFGRDGFNGDAEHYENLLDVLAHAGVNVLWRDNNAGCKGVCARVASEQVSDNLNPVLCHAGECYDEELLTGLQEYLDKIKGDTVVVLHQMGSHGPSYYLRHPASYTRFQPECAIANVEDCSSEMLMNAYDNTIAYTDHFLAEVIHLLKRNSAAFDSAMVYVSDHGESLGEHGVYLHGLPYAFAPDEQKKVPMVLWLSDELTKGASIDGDCLARNRDTAYSHDNLFHSVLGVMAVETAVYRAERDLFSTCRTG
ncbi:MAG: putative lipid A phosphoethanolamine transferase [Gammaproteobacteria bacterium]|nr:MAG: putative lipid A phosphoethanolamine transferase [Gammaproteobacteria bacterium]TND02615.1 MAG: putative lipid A phosphoethanolamine transferase [Gammaproteobacteria bacterium]